MLAISTKRVANIGAGVLGHRYLTMLFMRLLLFRLLSKSLWTGASSKGVSRSRFPALPKNETPTASFQCRSKDNIVDAPFSCPGAPNTLT